MGAGSSSFSPPDMKLSLPDFSPPKIDFSLNDNSQQQYNNYQQQDDNYQQQDDNYQQQDYNYEPISTVIYKSGCDLNNISSTMTDNVFKQVIQTQDSVMSQYDIILKQLNDARTLNDQLSSANASLWDRDAKQKSQISNLSTSLDNATEQIHIDETTIGELNDSVANLTAIRKNLENEKAGLQADKEYLQKKNILDKTIALIKENMVLINQITNNKENYSTDFQQIFYKEQQLMQVKTVNFYLLFVYYFFIIILIYFAFFNKNNFSLYFKVFWILFLVILPLLGFFFIDIILQTLNFLWRYVFSFIYGDRYHSREPTV
jgi:hypothetical protein